MVLLSPLFHPLQQIGTNWISGFQKQQFLGNDNADLHLKPPFVLGWKCSGGEEGNRESTLLHCPQTQRPWQLYKQKSLVFPTFSYFFSPEEVIPGLAQEEEFELSKSTVFTKKPLDNFPIQINTERRDKKMAPSFSGSHNTKYLQLQRWELKRKHKSMESAPPIIRKKIPLQ